MPGSAERQGRRPADAGAASGDEDGCHGETLRGEQWESAVGRDRGFGSSMQREHRGVNCAEAIGYQLPRSNHEAWLLVIQTLFGWVSRSDVLIQALTSAR